jgi:hypothetical protein
MALPLLCECLRDDLGFEALLGIHLLEAPVLILQLLHASHQGRVHAAVFGTPLVESGVADSVLPAQLGNGAAGFGLLEDGDDLAVGKAGRLHVALSVLK